MIQEKNVEHLENSSVKLSVKIKKDFAKKEYDSLLQDYSKKAHIKGFRPGKAPASVLESKFGEGIRMEAAQKIIESALKKVFEEIEEKPLAYSTPKLEDELDFKPGEAFKFEVTYDVFPKIEIKKATGLTIEEPQVTVGKEDLEQELKQIQEQNALVVEKSEGAVEDGNIITMDYVELDENDAEIADTNRQDFSFTVGSEYSPFKIDKEIIGVKKDEETIITKTFADDEEEKELAGKTIKLKVKVTKIKVRDLPELDDELAQDVDEKYKTLDDLKKDIKERLQHNAEHRVDHIKRDALIDQLVENNPITVPESMVAAELENNWYNFIRQMGGNEQQLMSILAAQGKQKEDVLADWKDDATKRLKGQLIIQEIIKQKDIKVEDAELEKEFEHLASHSNMSVEDTKDYYEKNNMMDYLKNDLSEKKAFEILFTENTVKKGKKTKYLDLMQANA
jgi:trigger factor